MAATIKKTKCEGKRRKMQGHVWGVFRCGRNATWTFQSYVGLCTTHYVCDSGECMSAITSGYRPMNLRKL